MSTRQGDKEVEEKQPIVVKLERFENPVGQPEEPISTVSEGSKSPVTKSEESTNNELIDISSAPSSKTFAQRSWKTHRNEK